MINKQITMPPKLAKRKTCFICNKPLNRHQNAYCSHACATLHKRQQLYAEIEKLGRFPEAFDGEADKRTMRNYLLMRFGHKCSICGTTEWRDQPVPLILDHIDGNAFNSSIDNIRLVCPNCDAQLPTYKARNKGNGRASRRKAMEQAS